MSSTAKTSSKSAIGAPSQHGQSSRKGKKAWRKNVDLDEVEESLEGLRVEERVTGGVLQKKKDSELFQIDVTGDAQVKRAMRSSRPLKSTAILSQRSAVPALLSRTTTRKHGRLTPEEKERLLKLGKRKRKFLGSFVESSEIGGVALEQRSAYDVWEEDESEDERLKKVLKTDEAKEYLLPLVKKPKVKAPSKDVRKEIGLPAIADPHPGTSYNPTTSAHNELLLAANRVEEEKEKEVEKLAGVSATIEAAKRSYVTDERDEGAPSGMKIDVAEEGSEEEEEGEDADIVASKPPPRKTKQQRQKAARVLAEKRAAADRATRRQLASTINSIKSLRQTVESTLSEQERAVAQKKLEKLKEIKKGLAGKRLGKHTVPEAPVDVQLGDELSETLRELKPEGNLFKDRFLSLQHRALVEPRTLVLRKRRTLKFKEYEKHPWKRFT